MIIYAFAHYLYLLIGGVKLDLGLVDVQGISIVTYRLIGQRAIFPGPEYQLVAGVDAVGLIKPESPAVHLEREAIHEVQQLRRKGKLTVNIGTVDVPAWEL